MPKIVDRDKYRRELAEKAAPLFAKHGYSGLGMRTISAELGLSKSALYHYFPTKQALFHACTDVVTNIEGQGRYGVPPSLPKNAPIAERLQMLIKVTQFTEGDFPDDLSLLVDYLRGRPSSDVANDPTMILANKRYRSLVGTYLNEEDTTAVQCLLLGTMVMRFFDGKTTKFEDIESWLIDKMG